MWYIMNVQAYVQRILPGTTRMTRLIDLALIDQVDGKKFATNYLFLSLY